MLTAKEKSVEFWMLTKGVLQDSKVDTDEAVVIKRWLEEHKAGSEFDVAISKLEGFLKDGCIDRVELKNLIDSIGSVLATLRNIKDA